MNSKMYTVDSLSFFLQIIKPAFADLLPDNLGSFNGTLGEFTVMDDVSSSRPIQDLRRVSNIMQKRDASCDYNYKQVMKSTNRKVTVEEMYAATDFCRNSFYQGDLKDWRNNDKAFAPNILRFFQDAVKTDLTSNVYFGDVDRVVPANAVWSTNIFDGIFKWLKRYTASGVIPASQTLTIAANTDYSANPTAAYQLIKTMYDRQPQLMRSYMSGDKAYYVSQEIASGYEDYLIAAGQNALGYITLQNGVKQLAYKGIPILINPTWTAVITELNGGTAGYAAILTLRTNFVFATDKQYGEGEDGHTALEIWYEKKDSKWYFRYYLKGGTQIGLPEFVVYALTSFV